MDPSEDFREGDIVVAALDMPGIPAGTKGRVTMVEGLSWIRYWVHFDNGIHRGSLHRKKLARPREWAQQLARAAPGDMHTPGDMQSADEETSDPGRADAADDSDAPVGPIASNADEADAAQPSTA